MLFLLLKLLQFLNFSSVNGGFSKWSTYSKCTVSCGGGSQERTRLCNNPEPRHGGSECIGPVRESALCGETKCPSKYGIVNIKHPK